MFKYPQHRISEISDIGIGFLQISLGQAIKVPVTYKHQDDYYMFGFVESGTCRLHVDFQDYELKGGEAMFLLPGQVHAFDEQSQLNACVLLVDSVFVKEEIQQSLVKYMFSHRLPLVLDSVHGQELKQLYSMLANRMKNSGESFSRYVKVDLALAIVHVFAEAASLGCHDGTVRDCYVAHTLHFLKLLDENLAESHSPSYYADKLCISPVYLNESVKATTGLSVSRMIQYEIVLRAKRMLAYTDCSVKEIALELGFDDCSYFIKIFTKQTGISPVQFRKNHKYSNTDHE